MQKKILLIEDDFDAAKMLKKILTKAGYVVDVLHEGRDIVEGKFNTPDLFILDNKLPGIEGVAICKYLRIKPVTRQIPVIIISGNDHLAERSNIAGANIFMAKPLDACALLDAVKTHLSEDVSHE